MTEYFQTVPLFHAGLALTYCQLGRLRDAEPLFERLAEDDFRHVPRDWQWLSTMDILCEICWRLHDRARGAVLLELMTPFAERIVVLGAWAVPRGVAARSLGLLELLLGRHDDAVRQLRRAVELNARLGVQSAELVAQLDLARALHARGAPQDQRAAEELVAEVEHRATMHGLHAVAVDATTLGRTLSDTEGPVMPAAAPRPLRERASIVSDVARSALSMRGRALMARGLTQVTDDQLERRFSHPLAQRALFTAMARSFQPRLAFGFHGELGFELYSKVTDSWEWWTLVVQGDRVNPRRRPSREPAMVVRVSVADFVRLLTGQLNAIGLWMEQKVDVEGDLLMGSRLVDMFGGVSLLEALPGTEDPVSQF